MCGIVGCVSREGSVTEILIGSLRRLEYRGYDSAGIAVIDPVKGTIRTVREVGRISNLEATLNGVLLKGTTGLGHTRWATHGAPSERNAHPHGDCHGDLVVVHNGIIENYRELKAALLAEGHRFISETDTEVLAHLIEKHYRGDLGRATREALRLVRGAYALGVLHRKNPKTVVGARKDSPLVVGIGRGQTFLASDVPALLDRTKDVIFLEDDEVATLGEDGVTIVDMDGRPVNRAPERILWDVAQAEKGGYAHFMQKEIFEQPRVVTDTLLGRLRPDEGDVELEVGFLDQATCRDIAKIDIVACGTSWHAGLVGKFLIERFTKIPVEVDYASEFRYRDIAVDRKTLTLAISQSGETADTLAAFRKARREGSRGLVLCNVVGSPMARDADGVVLTHAGPEIGVASTKAFVAQLVGLLLIALHVGRRRGTTRADAVSRMIDALRQLPSKLERTLELDDRIRTLAARFAEVRDVLYIGRGINYPIALEGALKLKEISYIHAEGYPAGEMKHGPIALVDPRLPIVAVATRSPVYEKIVSNIEEARARGGRVLALVTEGDRELGDTADEVVELPETPEELSPVLNVVPLQLLAYHAAVLRGCDVDKPRNLAKSVTVE